MKTRPIIFNTDMMQAILRGQKTQTRRPVIPQPFRTPPGTIHGWEWERRGRNVVWIAEVHLKHCPLGQPGDRLWVRETFAETGPPSRAVYRADDDTTLKTTKFRWTPSIHMPRRLSRITLEITDVSARHIQDITEEDAWAEGMRGKDARCTYAHLWDTLYAARGIGWGVNPWVWVVSFKRLES